MNFGYAPNVDLRFMFGWNDDHNEAAWCRRLPYVFRFLLGVREEPNPLQTPALSATGAVDQVSFPVYAGAAYAVEWTDALTNGWKTRYHFWLFFYWFCYLIWRALPYLLHRMKCVIGL